MSRFEGGTNHLRLWGSEEFQAQALDWIRAAPAGEGTVVHGPLVPHRLRFWSAVFTVETARGRLWFKATNPGQAFEAGLLAELARLMPQHVVNPVAVDRSRGWLLLPDGGTVLAARERTAPADWHELLIRAAQLQAGTAPHADKLLAAGLPLLTPEQGTRYAAELIDALAMLPASHPQHLHAAQAGHLAAGLHTAGRAFRDLEAVGIPLCLQPNDVTPQNAFRDAAGLRLFDFGDAFWSHPFAVLQVPMRMACGSWPRPAPAGDAAVNSMAGAYMGQWPLASGSDLRILAEAADRLASLHRCESWRRLLAGTHPDAVGDRPPRLADWLADALRPASRS